MTVALRDDVDLSPHHIAFLLELDRQDFQAPASAPPDLRKSCEFGKSLHSGTMVGIVYGEDALCKYLVCHGGNCPDSLDEDQTARDLGIYGRKRVRWGNLTRRKI